MVQAAAASQLCSPVQGRQVSASRSSMWPVLVLGILTAVFAWIWYRGTTGEAIGETPAEVLDPTVPGEKERDSPHRPQAAHRASRETDPGGCEPNSSEQQLPGQGIDKKVVNLQDFQPKKEQQPKVQVKELSDEDLDSGLEAQSIAAAADPLNVQVHQISDGPTKGELQGPTQEHDDVPEEEVLPGDLQRQEELQVGIQEHPAVVLSEKEPQVGPQEYLTDVLKKGELQVEIQEHPMDVPMTEVAQAGIQEHPMDVPKMELTQADIQEHPMDVPKMEVTQADIQEHPMDVPKMEVTQAHIQEHPMAVPKMEVTQAHIQEHPTDVTETEVAQADIQEHPMDVPKMEMTQADTQEYFKAVSNKDEEANLLEHQASVPVKEGGLLEEHLKGLVQASAEEAYKEFLNKSDEIHRHEVDAHPSKIPEVGELLINGAEVHTSLKKEVQLGVEEEYPQDDLDKAMVHTNGAVMCSTLLAEELGTPKLQVDSCHASKSEQETGQGKVFLHPVFGSQDGVYANGEMNGAEKAPENATGCPLANTFVKENAVNILVAEMTSNQDLPISTLSDAKAIVAEFMPPNSSEECDLKSIPTCSGAKKPSTLSQDNTHVFASSLSDSTQERWPDVQKLVTGPEPSPVNICSVLANQEKASFSNANTDEKTSFGSAIEANAHDIDQKPKKIATIQPMPQNVNFAFRVHYITHSDSQIIAIIGDHEKLGKWKAYVPLTSGSDGFWSCSIPLPADATLAWKFVMVENGKIKRWEECNNRFLKIAHEDTEAHLFWGYP